MIKVLDTANIIYVESSCTKEPWREDIIGALSKKMEGGFKSTMRRLEIWR